MSERNDGSYFDGDPNYREQIRNEIGKNVMDFAKSESEPDFINNLPHCYRTYSLLLTQASETLINKLSNDLVKDSNIGGYICKAIPVVFSPHMVNIFEQISYLKDYDFSKDKSRIKLVLPQDKEIQFDSFCIDEDESYPLLFLTALLNNAAIHGTSKNKELHRIEVDIKEEDGYLTLSNFVFAEDLKNRKPENSCILKAISYYYIRMNRACGDKTKLFEYSYEEDPDRQMWYKFTAKLPRIEDK